MLKDLVELWPSTVQNDRIKSHTIKEAEAESKFVDLVKNSSADLDDGKFGGL